VSEFERLFSPVRLGARRAKNRVMMLATTSGLSEGRRVSERQIAFLLARARGGVGTIVTEAMAAHPSSRGAIAAYDPAVVPGLARLAEAVQAEGVVLVGQISHGGRQHHASSIPLVWGPSALACPHSGGTPHEMDLDEIRSVVEGFVQSARNVQQAGLDGVEIHAAQGHLLQQFLSPLSNRRTDEYGGPLEQRMRLVREVLEAVRRACGPELVVGLRFGVDELVPEGLHVEEAAEAAGLLAAAGLVDYFSVSQSAFVSIEAHIPDRQYPRAPFIEFPARVKQAVGAVPVVGCGRIIEPAAAEAALAAGQFDLLGLCRPLLADAEWARKAAEGLTEEIRRCLSCNQCWGWITHGQPIGCVHNASTGRELSLGPLEPAPVVKRVVVSGGGPAGREAARVAAERGHRVMRFERDASLGGATLLPAAIPGHEELGEVARYLRMAVERAGVEARLGAAVSAEQVLAERPEAVIVATGARQGDFGPGPTGELPVLTPREAVPDPESAGKRVLLLDEDGYYQALETAEQLAHHGAKVWIVTRVFEVGREVPPASRITSLRALDRLGVEMAANAWLARVEGHEAVLTNIYSGREWSIGEVDSVVHVGGMRGDDDLYKALKGRVESLHLVGDALMPRRIADAVQEGHLAGRAV
jgi:2,4-dienoyl-CoA reductase-like NADH-dependent reductase (Old Yellow Enzyme family)/thioredoxin reductase